MNAALTYTRNAVITAWCWFEHLRYMCARYKWHRTFLPGKAIDQHGDPIPWFSYPSVEWIKSQDWSGKTVMEFGAGYGSLFWAKHARRVVCHENHPHFRSANPPHWVRALLDGPPNLHVIATETDAEYCTAEPADVYIIDGTPETRLRCALSVAAIAKPGDIVICDNVNHLRFDACFRTPDYSAMEFIGPVPGWPVLDSTAIYIRK